LWLLINDSRLNSVAAAAAFFLPTRLDRRSVLNLIGRLTSVAASVAFFLPPCANPVSVPRSSAASSLSPPPSRLLRPRALIAFWRHLSSDASPPSQPPSSFLRPPRLDRRSAPSEGGNYLQKQDMSRQQVASDLHGADTRYWRYGNTIPIFPLHVHANLTALMKQSKAHPSV